MQYPSNHSSWCPMMGKTVETNYSWLFLSPGNDLCAPLEHLSSQFQVSSKVSIISWRFHKELAQIFRALFLCLYLSLPLSVFLSLSLLPLSLFVYVKFSTFWYSVLQDLAFLASLDCQIYQLKSKILPGFSYLSPSYTAAWKLSPRGKLGHL